MIRAPSLPPGAIFTPPDVSGGGTEPVYRAGAQPVHPPEHRLRGERGADEHDRQLAGLESTASAAQPHRAVRSSHVQEGLLHEGPQ